MTAPSFQQLIATITNDQPPRVWSLLVTVFGELAQDPGARISGAVLGRVTGLIGIKPQAMRVALHRLRKDGWIESVRSGRSSHYHLSDRGRAESARANPAIYLRQRAPDRAWLVTLDTPGPVPGSVVPLSPTQAICAENPASDQALSLMLDPDTQVPDWVKTRVCGDELCAQSLRLERKLARLAAALPQVDPLSATQIATLRVLIIHDWRRLVLKTPNLPPWLFPDPWQGERCKTQLAALLASLAAQELDAIERDQAA